VSVITRTAPAALQRTASGLEYRVRRSRRRTLGLYVYADGRVEVRAPLGYDADPIHAFVATREHWIRSKLLEFQRRPRPPAAKFGQGDAQPYLGRAYPLRLQQALQVRVTLTVDALCVAAPDTDQPARVSAYLQLWYRRQAHVLFAQRLALGRQTLAEYALPECTLKIRAMKTRWGSCSRRGSITLNLELIKYPLVCLDYVVAHELCHLLEFNHSPRFYALMDAAMPDWRERKALLNAGEPARGID
jgi:predicted metal-dependent hydrolase